MSRLEWLTERQNGVGGSEVSAVVGLSKWRSPFDVWLDKTSPIVEQPPTLPMELGTYLEDFIVDKYRQDTGNQVQTNLDYIAMEKAPWRRCNLDGLVTLPGGDHGVLEAKTSGDSRSWGEPGSAEIPQDYFCQVQWNMHVAGLTWADVPVLFFDGSRRIECYHVEADNQFQAWMAEAVDEFWASVISGEPPEPTTGDEAAAMWPKHEPGKTVEVDEQIVLQLEQLKALKAESKKTSAAIKMIESELKVAIGDAEALADGERILATWKASTSKRLDTSALKAAHKELCDEFTKTTSSRRLLIK